MHRALALILLISTLAAASGSDDAEPPVMLDAWLDRDVVGPGEEMTVSMEWSDDSGMDFAYAVPWGPNDLHGHFDQCYADSAATVVVLECTIRMPEYAPAGDWHIGQMTGQDNVGHRSRGHVDLQFTVESPYSDVSPPEFVALDQTVTSHEINTTSDWFQVADAFTLHTDDQTGIHSGSLSFTGPGDNQGLWGQCDPPGSQVLSCDVHGPRHLPAGTYTLTGIGISDRVGYHAWYADDPDHSRARPLAANFDALPTITIVADGQDAAPPRLEGFTFPSEVTRGEPFTVHVRASEETALQSGWFGMQTTRGNAMEIRTMSRYVHDADQDVLCEGSWEGEVDLTCTMRFPSNFPLGLTQLQFLGLSDPARNEGYWSPQFNGYLHYEYMPDDEHNDTALMIMPRPLEGALHAIDAIFNEVVPGDVAEIVYEVEDTVDEVVLTLENEIGAVVNTTCDATQTVGLEVCELIVPDEAAGIYTLTQADVVSDMITETVTYTEAVPLLAVATSMPTDAYEAVTPPPVKHVGSANQLGAQFKALAESSAEQEMPEKPPVEPPEDSDEEYVHQEEPSHTNATLEAALPDWAIQERETIETAPPTDDRPVRVDAERPTGDYNIPVGPVGLLALLVFVRRQT